MQRVRNDRSLMTLPHLFSIAEKAYQRLRSTHTDQSIIPMGISGSGKSRAMNNVLHYLTSLPKTKGCSLTGKMALTVSFYLLFPSPLVVLGFINLFSAFNLTCRPPVFAFLEAFGEKIQLCLLCHDTLLFSTVADFLG